MVAETQLPVSSDFKPSAVHSCRKWGCLYTTVIHEESQIWFSFQIVPLQITLVVAWGALPLGCPSSPVESWPSSSWELQFYTPAERLSPPWCMMRNQGSRGLWCEKKRRKRNDYSLWFKLLTEMDTPPSCSLIHLKSEEAWSRTHHW